MNDLISRQAAIDAIEHVTWYHQNRNGQMVSGANSDEHQAWYKAEDVYEAIEAVPSANKSGHWIHDTHYGLNLPEHKCSECGTWEYSDEESNFCPNCGADMRGESDD